MPRNQHGKPLRNAQSILAAYYPGEIKTDWSRAVATFAAAIEEQLPDGPEKDHARMLCRSIGAIGDAALTLESLPRTAPAARP